MLERRLEDGSASMDRLSAQLADLTQSRDNAEHRNAALEGELNSLRSSRNDWDAREVSCEDFDPLFAPSQPGSSLQEENRSLHILKAELERRLHTMSEMLHQREETIEELKKESSQYHQQVERFSPEIRNLQVSGLSAPPEDFFVVLTLLSMILISKRLLFNLI